jgi:hypothetical protein
MASSNPLSGNPDINDEEDDYMTMSFADTSTTKHESSLQRRQRQKQEVRILNANKYSRKMIHFSSFVFLNAFLG